EDASVLPKVASCQPIVDFLCRRTLISCQVNTAKRGVIVITAFAIFGLLWLAGGLLGCLLAGTAAGQVEAFVAVLIGSVLVAARMVAERLDGIREALRGAGARGADDIGATSLRKASGKSD